MAVNGGSYLSRRAIKISGELDLLVADRGHLGQSTVEISLHLVAHAVQLHADLIDLMVRRGLANSVGEQGGRRNRGGGLKERTAIHHRIFSDVVRNPDHYTQEAALGAPQSDGGKCAATP